ncbi:hypothetical protein [Streptomyces sp. ITFR-6]|uniref:DUF6197 family protein n=1 Tax=Streptomyces sp. ITFR-6 TaxID=3075197 RepID=UPI00288AE9B8|nr:hypothetical protein [Streptomyces sp. ITFR-6]WNI34403.1 hypothetical protein RLT59_37935 [Streptomyces sp. ITFR-6]
MFELNRGLHRSQDLEATADEFVRDIETFVAGTIAASTPSSTPVSLIERAWALAEDYTDWLRWGPSGMPMTGEQIAAHAETAITILRTAGWNPTYSAGRSISDALTHAINTDPDHRFSTDTRVALRWIFALLIRALTGAPHADYNDWDKHPARTVEEVFGLLAAAAVFARAYGDAEPVPQVPDTPAA